MTLTNPAGLLGLLSLPVILALHLLLERRRRIVVSDLGLWSFLQREARGAKPHRLPLTWLLILDLLIGVLLSLAWAQPKITTTLPWQKAHHSIILIDVSTSMKAVDISPSRFSQAISETRALLNALGPRDVVTLITFGRQAHWVGDSRQDGLPELIDKLARLEPGETGHALDQAIALGLSAIDNSSPVEFHILSDVAFSELPIPTINHSINWHKYGKHVPNQAVVDISSTLVEENRRRVFARFVNFGDETASRVAAFLVDGVPIDSKPIQIPPESVVSREWILPQGSRVATVTLIGNDALPDDDTASIGLPSQNRVKVSLVTDEPQPFQKAIESLPETELQVILPTDYSPTGSTDLTIFRNWLPEEWPPGHILVIDPPDSKEKEKQGFPELIGQQVVAADDFTQVDVSDTLISGINFGSVRWGRIWNIAGIPDNLKPIVQVGGKPILLSGELKTGITGISGMVILLADSKSGNFTQDPAFPIFLYNLMNKVRPNPLPSHIQSGDGFLLPSKGDLRSLHIQLPNSDEYHYRADWPVSWEKTWYPGVYQLESEDIYGRQHAFRVGVNAGHVDESDLRPQEWVEISFPKTNQADSSSSSPQINNQLDLMPWLLGVALLALFLEAMLAWRT